MEGLIGEQWPGPYAGTRGNSHAKHSLVVDLWGYHRSDERSSPPKSPALHRHARHTDTISVQRTRDRSKELKPTTASTKRPRANPPKDQDHSRTR